MRTTIKTAAAGIALAGAIVMGSASLVAAREASSGGHDRGRVELESERPGDTHGRGDRRAADDTPGTTIDDSTTSTVPGSDAVGVPGDDDGTPDQGPGDAGAAAGAPVPTTVDPSRPAPPAVDDDPGPEDGGVHQCRGCDDSADDGPAHDVGDDHGVDDPATHDVGDDHGVDDPATHDVGDDHGDDDSGHHGDDDGDDDSGHHGDDDSGNSDQG